MKLPEPLKLWVVDLQAETVTAVQAAEISTNKVTYTEPDEKGYIGCRRANVFLHEAQALEFLQLMDENRQLRSEIKALRGD